MKSRLFRVSAADQRWFASFSGDFNPVHTDAVAARRIVAGEPIAHGMHLLLHALDAYLSAARVRPIVSISARFERPAFIGEAIAPVQRPGGIALQIGNLTLVDVSVESQSSGQAGADHEASNARDAGHNTGRLRVRTLDDIGHASGTLALPDARAAARRFPRVTQALGADAIAAIGAISRLVGMECPGRDSLLSSVCLRVVPRERARTLRWRVDRIDARFRLVRMTIGSGGVSGAVDAFLRPQPAPPPTFDEVASKVRAGEFTGQRALIVGGSRGLGAAAALAVAAGGGAALITFVSGSAEASALRRTAARARPRIDAMRFDVTRDSMTSLARACGRFRPTHLYYFATPRIFVRRHDPFDDAVFRRFTDVYVSRFAEVCLAARSAVPSLTVFYPSTTALDGESPRELTEYAAAKAAGERLCRTLNNAASAMTVVVRRLPRVTTDQTASILPVAASDPVAVLVPIVRDMQAATRA